MPIRRTPVTAANGASPTSAAAHILETLPDLIKVFDGAAALPGGAIVTEHHYTVAKAPMGA